MQKPIKYKKWLLLLAMCMSLPLVFAKAPKEHGAVEAKGETEQFKPYLIVHNIIISGNKVTKAATILKELTFKQHDKIMVEHIGEVLQRSRQNLLNLSIFNFVSISYSLQQEQAIFHIRVEERWYWWVFPIIEHADRNFSSFLEQGDLTRMNYGMYLQKDNFRGRNESLRFKFRVGVANEFAVFYDAPQLKGKSGWGLDVYALAHNQMAINSVNNKPVYMKFDDEPGRYQVAASVFYHYRPQLYRRHRLAIAYHYNQVNDTLLYLNPDFLTNGKARLNFVTLSYSYSYDKRDSKVYPLKGFFFLGSVSKLGFGIWDKAMDDVTLEGRLGFHTPLAKRFYYGVETFVKGSSSDQLPYMFSAGLGYKNFINGYELYVVDGTRYGMVQNRLLFNLVETKVVKLNFIPLSQFSKIHYALYLRPFFDLGYVNNQHPRFNNRMANEWQYGYGLGLDLVTFYDKVFSINYSFNKFGEHGFYAHLNLTM
jgi:outer membrane protein assembly factor BamA